MSQATVISVVPGPGSDVTRAPATPDSFLQSVQAAWINSRAIAGLVVKELFRRKDFYVLFILTALLTLILGSANFFNEDKIVRILRETCLDLVWIASLVIAITTAARQIPAERESRTIFPLLAKPVTRSHVVLGKFLGCWQACGIALAVFYAFFAIVTGARGHEWPLAQYLQAITLHWFMLGVVIAMTVLGSIVFAAPSSNNTITFLVTAAILLFGRHLNKVALQLPDPTQTVVYSIYFLIPHLELFDVRDLIVHDLGAIDWLFWLGAIGYAVVYTILFLAGACWMFRRKAVN